MSDLTWENLSLKEKIICFINYASVFNDVISIEELAKKLCLDNSSELKNTLEELIDEKLILLKKGYVAVPALEFKISEKKAQIKLSNELVSKKIKQIKLLARLPMVKFIGLSGSLAVNNPTENDLNKLDIDLFVITKKHMTWLFILFEAFLRNMIFLHTKNPLCLNHIMEESDMKVYNQNFYTAHELRNLKPIVDKGVHALFTWENKWAWKYFPELALEDAQIDTKKNEDSVSKINLSLFVLFSIFRCAKNLSLKPLKEIRILFNPNKGYNINRKSSPFGGYQMLVMTKFKTNFKKYFLKYYNSGIPDFLFNDDLSQKLKEDNFELSTIEGNQKYINHTMKIYTKYS